MKKKLTVFLMVLCFVSITNATIYVDGQLYSGNTLNINQHPYGWSAIMTTENSILNIYYLDQIVNGHYGPAVNPYVIAKGNSVINFIYPQNYNFDIEYGGVDFSTINVYEGLQISNFNYPSIAGEFDIMRIYDPGINHILTPLAGFYQLQDNAVMNFVPEPATILFLLMGFGGVRKSTDSQNKYRFILQQNTGVYPLRLGISPHFRRSLLCAGK